MFKLFQNSAIVYGLSQKSDGNMHLGFKGNKENREKFFAKKELPGKKIVSADLIHGINIVEADLASNSMSGKTDGLVSYSSGLILTLTVADCFPVYFFDPVKNVVALAHCGWRGTVGNLAGKTVTEMKSNPADILAGIGPGIKVCHFEVKEDILPKFFEYPEAIVKSAGKFFVDLSKIIKKQLADAGVKNIESFGECTYENADKYFSFRRDKPLQIEAMMAYIGLK